MDGSEAAAGCCAAAEPPSVSASPVMTAAPATSSTPPAAAATATGPAWRTWPRTRWRMERREETSGPFEGAACAPPPLTRAPTPAAPTAPTAPAAASGARKRAMSRSYSASSAGPVSADSRSSAATSSSIRPRQSRQPSMWTAIRSAWYGESAPRTWSGSPSQCPPHAALAG
ncbi:hypothetical protein SVIO_084460 [Streptomyces violaceusniger]|uniref:Uncharacterized protein n=1 Tax=Streptomyces violaceusniger TaxID=68280 RepID=A0A4D4LIE6_STRVO|nr:hypothetical protein SVIO_084460 [Streptomyces violaceusniger]